MDYESFDVGGAGVDDWLDEDVCGGECERKLWVDGAWKQGGGTILVVIEGEGKEGAWAFIGGKHGVGYGSHFGGFGAWHGV